MTKLQKIVIIIFIVLTTFFIIGIDSRPHVVTYDIKDEKINNDVKIALITDLHSCDYGENQNEIFELLDAENPDLVLMSGDIVDDKIPEKKAYEFIGILGEKYESYYVTGNHEIWTRKYDEIKKNINTLNVKVLDGICKEININECKIDICGVDDPDVGEDIWEEELNQASEQRHGNYSILLTHRPERIQLYADYNYDLALAGHAHGGQWRIPLIMNGLFAPNQGLFPKYAGGKYELNNTCMVVSRGLARESTRFIPRVYNKPEIVILNLSN